MSGQEGDRSEGKLEKPGELGMVLDYLIRLGKDYPDAVRAAHLNPHPEQALLEDAESIEDET